MPLRVDTTKDTHWRDRIARWEGLLHCFVEQSFLSRIQILFAGPNFESTFGG